MLKKTEKAVSERVLAEKNAHNVRDVLAESYKLKDRFSHIWLYPSRKEFDQRFETQLQDISKKDVLDYGCGLGSQSIKYLRRGANVKGIDISHKYITKCIESAREAGFTGDQFEFLVMDAHKLDFPDNSFDIVAGNGILHHLSPSVAMKEIHRVLKPGGRVLLQEPLADNPLLKLFRILTPFARTEDERPFTRDDITKIVKNDLWISESFYCGILEAPIAIITSLLMPKNPNNRLLSVAHSFEQAINKKNSRLLSWNQYILFNLIKKQDT